MATIVLRLTAVESKHDSCHKAGCCHRTRGLCTSCPGFKAGSLFDSEIHVAHTSVRQRDHPIRDAIPAENQRLSAEVSVDPSGVIAVS
jgi:hypothetical protein